MENGLRLLSKVLRQVATSRRFTTYSELKDAFRGQLRHLRIRYQQHAFDDVFAIVGSNILLVHDSPAPRGFHVEPEPRALTHAEAVSLLAQMPGLTLRAMSPASGRTR